MATKVINKCVRHTFFFAESNFKCFKACFQLIGKIGLRFVIQGLLATFGTHQNIELCINLP